MPTAAAAEAHVASQPPDLILLDLKLPDRSGLPLRAELRTRREAPSYNRRQADTATPRAGGAVRPRATAKGGDESMATGMQRWAGTAAELARLRRAVEGHCSRSDRAHPWDEAVCPAHGLLARQSALDHLLYAYRARERFIAEELRPMTDSP